MKISLQPPKQTVLHREARRQLDTIEWEIGSYAEEHLYVVDQFGNIRVADIRGSDVTAHIPDEYLPMLKDGIITHNHPKVSSFSVDDLRVAAAHDAREIRAVDGKYIYRIIRPDTGWPHGIANDVGVIVVARRESVRRYLEKRIREGKMSESMMEDEYMHTLIGYALRQNGIYYIREAR